MTNSTLLTAYNKDIQKYVGFGCTNKRDTLLFQLETDVLASGVSFERLFPPRTKRKDVLKRILLLVSSTGIAKVSRQYLADNVGCSIRTVSEAVANLKDTGKILVAGLADGKNKYVFLLKSHDNFQLYLKDVFYLTGGDAMRIAGGTAQQEYAVNADTTTIDDDFQGSKSFKPVKPLITKHESDIISVSVENELSSVNKNREKESKMVDEYYSNSLQRDFYKYFRNDITLSPIIRDSIAILGLRLGSNCNTHGLRNANQAVMKIQGFISAGGTVREGIPALFTSIYRHGLNMDKYIKAYAQKNVVIPIDLTEKVKKVVFYNWLEERD